MASVGIRELRQRASELLRLVALGETVEITDRGRPVALLGPIPQGSELVRLREAGHISSARGEVDDLPAPIVLEAGQELPSAALARMRRDER